MAFALMDQRLLRCGGVRASTGRLTAIAFAAGAIASSLPAGPLVSSAFAFRQFRRVGASEGLAAWAILATLVFSALGLALLATGGVVIAERQGSAFDLVGVIVGVLVVAIIATAILVQKRALMVVIEKMLDGVAQTHRVPAPSRRGRRVVHRRQLGRRQRRRPRLSRHTELVGRQLGARLLVPRVRVSRRGRAGSLAGVCFLLTVQGSWRRTCPSLLGAWASSRGAS